MFESRLWPNCASDVGLVVDLGPSRFGGPFNDPGELEAVVALSMRQSGMFSLRNSYSIVNRVEVIRVVIPFHHYLFLISHPQLPGNGNGPSIYRFD